MAALGASCGGSSTIDCDKNEDCTQGGIPGMCLASPASSAQWCAFTDGSCPGTGLRWGAAAGDDLATTCVVEPDGGVTDAGVDAGPDAAHEPDAGDPPTTTSKIFVLASSGNSLLVFDAETLAPLGTVTLPVTQPSGLDVAEDTLWVLGGSMSGDQSGQGHVTAFDPRTTLLKSGYPKTMAGADCKTLGALATAAGVYCLSAGASAESDDVVHLMSPPDFIVAKSSPNTPSPHALGGSPDLVLASYGGSDDKTVGVFDGQLQPIAGSPLSSPAAHPIAFFAASKALNRIAIASLTEVLIYNAATLQQVGATATYSSTNIAGMAFDEDRGQLVITTTQGAVTTRAASDFAEKVAPVNRGGVGTRAPVVDATRSRIYLVDGDVPKNHLVVLDATTLDHVAGSPIELSTVGTADVAAF